MQSTRTPHRTASAIRYLVGSFRVARQAKGLHVYPYARVTRHMTRDDYEYECEYQCGDCDF